MTVKRIVLVFALLALLTAGVSAHDDSGAPGTKPMRGFGLPFSDETLLEATGLDAEGMRAALAEGSTIAELIEANEGDVPAVIAAAVSQMTEAINTDAAERIEALDELVSEGLNASHSRRGPWGRTWHRWPRLFAYVGAGDTIMEATGLDATGLRSALAEGSTLAELIEANDGDVESIAADIVASITEAINTATAERVESLGERVTEMFNTDFAEHWRRRRMRPRFFFGFWGMPGMPASEQPVG